MANIMLDDLEVRIWNHYDKYKNSNYGAHSQAVRVGNLTLFFSYETVIGFYWRGKEYFVENCYSSTTGKHLNNLCPDKSRRIKSEDFEKLLKNALVDFKWSRLVGA